VSFNSSNDAWTSVTMGKNGASNATLLAEVDQNLRRYRFCISSTGSFLMTLSSIMIGDIVCVLFGCDMPVVLREKEPDHYNFVGECFADDIMYGEAVEDLANGKITAMEFRIN
jgi:hypothetical protein